MSALFFVPTPRGRPIMVELVMDLPSALQSAVPQMKASSFAPSRSIPQSESTLPDPSAVSREKEEPVSPAISPVDASESRSGSEGRERILSLEEQYALSLRAMLEAKKSFPAMARKLGKEGKVTLQLVLDASGKVLQFSVAESSGTEILDQAALRLVEQIGSFPAFPQEIQRTSWQFFIPIEYRL